MARNVFSRIETAVTRFAMAAATLVVLLSAAGAGAQSAADRGSSDLGATPVAIDGWRYVKGPSDLHVYLCNHPGCATGSRASFISYPAGAAFPGQLRGQRGAMGEMLQERLAPCTLVFDGISLPLSPVPGLMHCVATAVDGTKTYDAMGIINGSNLSVSLISSSNDQTASDANYRQFEAALRAVMNSDLGTRP
jgi:hypothetical protein